MVGGHHRLDGQEFEQALGDGNGQGGLACCSPWGHRVRHDLVTGQLQLSITRSLVPRFHSWHLPHTYVGRCHQKPHHTLSLLRPFHCICLYYLPLKSDLFNSTIFNCFIIPTKLVRQIKYNTLPSKLHELTLFGN